MFTVYNGRLDTLYKSTFHHEKQFFWKILIGIFIFGSKPAGWTDDECEKKTWSGREREGEREANPNNDYYMKTFLHEFALLFENKLSD